MRQKFKYWHLAALILLSCLPVKSQAVEWPVFGPVKMEALLNYDYWKRQREDSVSNQYDLAVGLSIEGQGYWLDPEILGIYYYLEPFYVLSNYSARSTVANVSDQLNDDDRRGYAINYDLLIDILPGTTLPYHSTINFGQAFTVNNGSFGRHSETDLKYGNLSLEWQNLYFPLTLKYEVRDNYTVSDPGFDRRRFIRDDLDQRLILRGKSSKTFMELEHRSLNDRVVERNNDFDEDRFNLRHQLPWGSDSGLQSRFDYRNRDGFNAFKRTILDELARIKHGENLRSETRYQFRSTIQSQTTTANTGTFRLIHQTYTNLNSIGNLRLEDTRNDDTQLKEHGGGLAFAYNKPDFLGATVTARLSADYSINDLDSNAGFYEIIDQPYLVPLSGIITLEDRFIAPETIIVTDATSTVVYVEGLDYEVNQIIDNLTQVFILPGSQIIVGETVLISYKAAIIPSSKFSSLNTATGFSIKKNWFSFSYFDTQIRYDTISGNGGQFLADTRTQTALLGITWDMTRTSNQFSAERRFYKNGLFGTTTYTLTQSVNLSLSTRMMLNFRISGSQSTSDLEKTDMYMLNLDFLWRPSPPWTIRPTLGAWKRKRNPTIPGSVSGIIDERVLSASLNVRWAFRKIILDLNLRHNDRVADGADFVDDNVSLNMRRRF